MIENLAHGLELYKAPTWTDLNLPNSLTTSEARLEAVLNVVHSGAKSLETSVMSQDHESSSRSIIRDISHLTGLVISSHTNVSNHFNHSMEKLGIVEGSTRAGKWHLTPFGEAIKPAVIFFWRELLDLNTHPMAILNNVTQGSRDSSGNSIATAALTKVKLMIGLYQSGPQSNSSLIFRIGGTDLSGSAGKHIDDMSLSGVATTISTDNHTGESYLSYGMTTHGLTVDNWYNSDVFGRRLPTFTPKVAAQLKALGTDSTINFRDLLRLLNISKDSSAAIETIRVLAYFIRSGFVRKTMQGREVEGHSLTELTTFGENIVLKAVNPLVAWSEDPNSVAQIRQIALQFGETDHDLYRKMAEIFLATSPNVNRKSDHRAREILDLIENQRLTKTEIAHNLGLSLQTVARGLDILTASGNTDSAIDPTNQRRKFYSV